MNLQTRHKIALSFSLLLLAASTAYWLLFQNALNRSLQEYSTILGATLAEQTAASVRELVLVDDLLGLNVELSQLVKNENIMFVSVEDVDGNQLASAGRQNAVPDGTSYFSAPITVQEAIAGSVHVQLDLGAVDTFQARLRNIFLAVLAVSLVLVVTTAFALAGRLRSFMLALADTLAERLDDDDGFEDAGSDNETTRLQGAINAVLERMQDMEERLLETGIWQSEHGDAANQPARVNATILVVKVVNINTAIELLHPDTLAGLLQEYHYYLDQAARLYGGHCHRLSGESVMVSFDTDTCGAEHSVNALYCAGLFQSVMAAVNNRHRQQGEQALDFRMAIHSGDVFRAPGVCRSGGETAVDGIMGKTIDITYFLCKQAAPHELVISEPASSQAGKFTRFETTGRHQVSMPADNVSFMAYILASGFAADMALVQKQCRHILGPQRDTEGHL